MVYLIVAALVFAFSLVAWNLVHLSPRSIALFLPEKACLVIGSFLMTLGLFSAFLAAYAKQDAEGMIASIVVAYVGLWFLLVHFASSGSYEAGLMIRRLFAMMGMIMLVLLGTLYLGDSKVVAVFNLGLVGGGYWLTTSYLRYLDRGR